MLINGQILPYLPHVDFDYEIGQLNDLGMLKKVSNRKYEIELKGEVIGEIVAVTRFSL